MAESTESGNGGGGVLPWALAGNALLQTVGGFMDNGGGMTEGQRRDERFMNDFAWKQSLRNEAFQHELATHGIRMRVADAEAAGLHPLVGAGINPASGGFGGTAFSQSASSRPSLGSKLQNMGQSIERAAMATASREEKASKMLQLENMRINNEIAKVELASRLKDFHRTPSMPSPNGSAMGQGDAPVQIMPSRITAKAPGEQGRTAGTAMGTQYFQTQGGGLAPARSKEVTEALEDDFIGTGLWNLRTYGAHPFRGPGKEPTAKEYPLPPGYDSWMWIPHLMEYRPVNSKKTGIRNFIRGSYYYDDRR